MLAWLATIANVAGVDLTEAVMRKYGSGCPGCGRFVCDVSRRGKTMSGNAELQIENGELQNCGQRRVRRLRFAVVRIFGLPCVHSACRACLFVAQDAEAGRRSWACGWGLAIGTRRGCGRRSK